MWKVVSEYISMTVFRITKTISVLSSNIHFLIKYLKKSEVKMTIIVQYDGIAYRKLKMICIFQKNKLIIIIYNITDYISKYYYILETIL